MEYDKPGPTTEKPKKKPTMWEGVIEKSIVLLNDSENQKRIKQFVIDPVLTHVMNRMFPYILLICVLFTLLLIVAMLTFAIVFLQMRQSGASSLHTILPSVE